jgi:2-polyprenyl-3-methyl-5-hydroxy-6-metoxy-1,4-benzoquinol methylase
MEFGMLRPIEPEDAAAFWQARYAQALLYGIEPTSVARRLAMMFQRERVASILEAGCGSGRDALLYARKGFAVTGLDLSQNALRWAKEQADREGLEISLLARDLLAGDLALGSFDATVAIHLIHLQPEPIRRAMVNQLWLLTRDGGLVAMANYSTEEAGFTTWQPYPEPNTRVDPRGKLVHFFDGEDIAALLPPDRFDLLTCELVDLDETPDSGPVTHREWLTIARKIRAC